MQSNKEDDLLDYNALEEYNKSSGQHAKDKISGQRKTPSPAPDYTSHSPKQTPLSLKSDEDSDEVDSDLGKGQDLWILKKVKKLRWIAHPCSKLSSSVNRKSLTF